MSPLPGLWDKRYTLIFWSSFITPGLYPGAIVMSPLRGWDYVL